ncbi:hypothetical protein CEXT_461101 [Caerostris extrusa]|uniref:Uncharacterized protein n=1 Tax=Caerostris extrusa TaxID=172846 RepID=A0AAV4SFP8_CAEEX|nr:hypothetical protein CEXT_461101 [Caerostris extrusa]
MHCYRNEFATLTHEYIIGNIIFIFDQNVQKMVRRSPDQEHRLRFHSSGVTRISPRLPDGVALLEILGRRRHEDHEEQLAIAQGLSERMSSTSTAGFQSRGSNSNRDFFTADVMFVEYSTVEGSNLAVVLFPSVCR